MLGSADRDLAAFETRVSRGLQSAGLNDLFEKIAEIMRTSL